MRGHMPDSHLNEAERYVQQSFRKSQLFNGLMMAVAVAAVYLPMRSLPGRRALPPATASLTYHPVELADVAGPLRLSGAWEVRSSDRRFGGISSLTIVGGRFLSVSDRGAVAWFNPPGVSKRVAWVADLRAGPGPWGRKWARDAESLAADPRGRGWWVGYEQNHSVWLYDRGFERALGHVDLQREDWWNNRGAEGLVSEGDGLLVTAENGRDAIIVDGDSLERMALNAGADVADASRAPDGSLWILLRAKGLSGIRQAVAPLIRTGGGYRAGPAWAVPKSAFDNYEGMAIEPRPGGGLRFWLISDDGHRIMARTLLVALDHLPQPETAKSPATQAGRLKKPRN